MTKSKKRKPLYEPSVMKARRRSEHFNQASKVDLRMMLNATVWFENLTAAQFDVLRRSILQSAADSQRSAICTSLMEFREAIRLIGPTQVLLRAAGDSGQDGLCVTVIREFVHKS